MKFKNLLLIICCYLSFVQSAYAYLDPGTGSMLIQMTIAGIMGALFTLKMYWQRIKHLIISRFAKPTETSTSETADKEDDSSSES